MSFDTLFDYGNATSYLNARITFLQNDCSNVTNELNMIANLSSEFQELSNSHVTDLNNRLECHNYSINAVGNLVGEINIVEALPSDSKNNLVNFYQTYYPCLHSEYASNPKAKKIHFMRQMICHTGNISSDVGNLMAANVTMEQGNCIANVLDRKYAPERMTGSLAWSLL